MASHGPNSKAAKALAFGASKGGAYIGFTSTSGVSRAFASGVARKAASYSSNKCVSGGLFPYCKTVSVTAAKNNKSFAGTITGGSANGKVGLAATDSKSYSKVDGEYASSGG